MESKEDAVEVSVTEEVKEAPKERDETFSEVEEVDPEEESMNWKMGALEDLAEAIIGWRRPKDKTENVCDLCEKGKEDFKYGIFERNYQIKALEDLTVKLYKWKRPGQAGLERKYEENYDSMVDQRRVAMGYHGLDVEPY